MAQQTLTSGSSANDFQPVTGNPQSDVGGGLQKNSSNLQPLTSSTDSNVFNQPGINAQAFPKTNSLKVISTGTQSSPVDTQNTTPKASTNVGLTIFIFAAIAAVLVILILAKLAKPPKSPDENDVKPSKADTQTPKNKKKFKSKKKSSKKRSKS